MISGRAFSDDLSDTGGRQPPGAPCYPPPSFSDDSDEEIELKKDSADEAESEEDEEEEDEEDQETRMKFDSQHKPDMESKDRALAKAGDTLRPSERTEPDVPLQRPEIGMWFR